MSPATTLRASAARRHPILAALAAVALASGVAQFLGSTAAASTLATVSWTAAALFALLSCLVAVRETSDAEQRRRWSRLAAALGAWSVGTLAWAVLMLVGAASAMPSVADAGWLLFAPLAIIGVHRLSDDPPRVRALVLLDVFTLLTVACAAAVVVFYDEMVASELSNAGRITAVAYSSLYAGLLLTLVQSLFRRFSMREHPELVLLLIGLIVCALSFFFWTPQLLDQTYVGGGHPIDLGWTLGILAMGGAALEASGRTPLPPRNERDLGRTVLLPAAGVLVLLLTLPVLATGGSALGQRLVLQVGLVVAMGALITRLLLLSRWHLALVDEVRDLYDRAPCGYHSIDENGLILRMNDTELGWLGYDRDEIVGKVRVPDLLTPESAERWHSYLRPLRRNGALHDIEYDVVRKDGTILPVSLSATVVHDEHGKFIRSRSTIFDITERRRARGDLEAAASELRRSNTELEHFAYAASHDLAEPLRTIMSFGELLSRRYADELDEKGQRFLGHITQGAERMQRLMDAMLEYSRIGRSAPQPREVDAGELVDQVISSLAAGIRAQGASVTVGELPRVSGVPETLALLFQNLIANALKFTAERAPEVEVSAVRDDGAWRFTVADNGIGIDERHTERIFEMFQRLHARDEYEGTGIGLALCAKIAERHGGRIWVESTPGEGSRFHVTVADPEDHPR